MTRDEAIRLVLFQIDDQHEGRHAKPSDIRPGDRLVGFHQLSMKRSLWQFAAVPEPC
jgi:hypothetical protein